MLRILRNYPELGASNDLIVSTGSYRPTASSDPQIFADSYKLDVTAKYQGSLQKLDPCKAVVGSPAGCTWGQSPYLSPCRSARQSSNLVISIVRHNA